MAFTYNPYEESEAVRKAREALQANESYKASDSVTSAQKAMQEHEQKKVADWTGGTYGESLKKALENINNRQKFSYDLNGDALYQQYKDRYMSQGRLAMQDTMGQAAALTGGYGNSYASTAGNQAYQSYLQNLNDVVPELYQMAYDRYNQDTNDLYNQYNLYNDAYNTEYGQYRDRVSDWQTEADRLSNNYYNEANLDYNRFADQRDYLSNAFNTERSFDYNLYTDAYSRALNEYQLALSEASSGGSGGSSGGGGSSSRITKSNYQTEADPVTQLSSSYNDTVNKLAAYAGKAQRNGQDPMDFIDNIYNNYPGNLTAQQYALAKQIYG